MVELLETFLEYVLYFMGIGVVLLCISIPFAILAYWKSQDPDNFLNSK